MSFKLKISTKTWVKDNYGLFDYDLDKDMVLKEMVVKTEGTLARSLDEVLYISKARKSEPIHGIQNEDISLLNIKLLDGGAKVCQPEGDSKQTLWKQSSRNQNEFSCITKGDTFRLGKKQFTLLQANIGGQKQMMLDLDSHYHVSNIMNTFISEMESSITSQGSANGDPTMEKSERMPCRICLSSSSSRKNPLLAPCQCKGSARWIHFECIQLWINQRIQISEKAHYATIKTKCIKCELCMTLLPQSITVGEEDYHLYQFQSLKFEKFLVLEDSDGIIFILNLTSKNFFNIGRGHDCDIKLSEITVSRKHMRLEIDAQSRIKLFDLSSKFGTLVKVQKPLIIPYETPLELQNGRTHIKLRLIQQKSRLRRFFSKLCYCNKDEMEPISRSTIQSSARDNSVRLLNYSSSQQPGEQAILDQESEIENEEEEQVPELQSPSRVAEDNSQFNVTGEMHFNSSQEGNLSRQLGRSQQPGASQRQPLLSHPGDISSRSNTQLMELRLSSVAVVPGGSPREAAELSQEGISAIHRRASLQIQEQIIQRVQQLPSMENRPEEREYASGDHNRQDNREEPDRSQTEQLLTQQEEPAAERSMSIPLIIPHSNSAPSNYDYLVPLGYQ